MLKHLRQYFFTGLFVLLPIAVTLKLIFWGFEKTDAILGNFINRYLLNHFDNFSRDIPGLGIIALLLLITLTGIFARNYLGRKLIRFGESVLERIPVLNSVYSTVKQVTHGLAVTQKENRAFRQVVLVEYPRQGLYSPGFLVGETAEEFKEKTGKELVSVFVPTVPNPTTGFLIYLPADEIHVLDMSVEEALKMILSFGMIKPSGKDVVSKEECLKEERGTVTQAG